jgi:hypothetical protein
MTNLAIQSLRGALLAALLSVSPFSAAEFGDAADDSNKAPLFASHVPLQVTIEAPLYTLMKERPDSDYLEGTFTYVQEDGTDHVLDFKLRTRGNFRRSVDNCEFTPIRLNFRKKQVDDTVFDGQDKLKLVTHCMDHKPSFEQHVIREYLAYRILQLLTDKSFSVRLMHINYVDSDRGRKMTKYAFVIEDKDDVAERNGMTPIDIHETTHFDLDPEQEILVNVFQYMIGHTDFSLVRGPPPEGCCHNAVLLSASDGPPFTPVPYDFDFSGLVGAPYAVAHPKLRIRNVRERYFRGQCKNIDLLPDTIQQFLDKKESVYAIIDGLEMFTNKDRGEVTRYLDAFYEEASQAEKIRNKFLSTCD